MGLQEQIADSLFLGSLADNPLHHQQGTICPQPVQKQTMSHTNQHFESAWVLTLATKIPR